MTEPLDNPTGDPGIPELQALLNNGGWKAVRLGENIPTIYVRPWPDGSIDTLGAQHETAAYADRQDAAGRLVWRQTGVTLTEAIASLRELPAPSHPDAPRKPLQLKLDPAILQPVPEPTDQPEQ